MNVKTLHGYIRTVRNHTSESVIIGQERQKEMREDE